MLVALTCPSSHSQWVLGPCSWPLHSAASPADKSLSALSSAFYTWGNRTGTESTLCPQSPREWTEDLGSPGTLYSLLLPSATLGGCQHLEMAECLPLKHESLGHSLCGTYSTADSTLPCPTELGIAWDLAVSLSQGVTLKVNNYHAWFNHSRIYIYMFTAENLRFCIMSLFMFPCLFFSVVFQLSCSWPHLRALLLFSH